MRLAGELLVLERERRLLINADRADLATMVIHTAKVEGDGAGFDILPFFPDGRKKFIEVKTTTGPKDTDFLITANEVAFSAAHPNDFELCPLQHPTALEVDADQAATANGGRADARWQAR